MSAQAAAKKIDVQGAATTVLSVLGKERNETMVGQQAFLLSLPPPALCQE